MVYTAGSQSLAALEIVAHLDSTELLERYVVFEVKLDESAIVPVDESQLPRNWRADPPPAKVRAIGDAWAAARASVVLQVPSVIVRAENNYLLNPRHPGFSRLLIGKPFTFRFDPRLLHKD
jgi:RES domain-containing protein